jgi:flagellar basal-body rod modification protein FlgD
MSISGISGNDPASQATNGTQLKGTKDEFLKLFMAQLQHQDPFAPTSGADMVAQLAQLSAVEQAKTTNEQLQSLAAAQESTATASLSTLVGRDCNASLGAFQLSKDGSVPPPIDISGGPTKGASIVITDADGKELQRVPIPDGTKATSIQWNGLDKNGQPLKPGTYNIAVDGGSSPEITASWHGKVDAVELTAGGPRLRMGDLLLAPGDIRTIGVST